MRDISELTRYLDGLGEQMIPYGELKSYGWTEEEISCAKALLIPKPSEQNRKTHFWIAGLLIPLLLIGVAFASELPPTIQEWIDSNGTRGSPVFIESGDNVTIVGTSNVSLVNPDDDSGNAGSNPAGATNLTSNITLQNVTESDTPGDGGPSATLLDLTSPLTEEQLLLETEPLLKVYAGENKTLYVVDNHKFGDLIWWLIKRP